MGQSDDTVINSSQPSAGQAGPGVRSSMTSDTADSAVPSTSSTTSGTDPKSHQGMSLPAKSKQTDGQHNSALDYLAGNVNKKEVVGEKIDDQLATIVTDMLQMGMNKEIREKMMEEIHKPKNCKRLDVVLVNTGIFNNVNRETKSEDLSLQHIQKPLTKGLTKGLWGQLTLQMLTILYLFQENFKNISNLGQRGNYTISLICQMG